MGVQGLLHHLVTHNKGLANQGANKTVLPVPAIGVFSQSFLVLVGNAFLLMSCKGANVYGL